MPEQIISGDLFFFLKPNNSSPDDEPSFIDAVCLSASTTKVDHQVFHVGLFISETDVIHATASHGVIKETFTDAIISTKPPIVEIYRIQCSDDQRQAAITFAHSNLGAKYNDIFSPKFINSAGDKAFYCCQFICAAYGREMFNPHSLNFLDENGQMLEYWIKYFGERNEPIPQGLPGSHPSIIRASKCLSLIKSFKISKDLKIVENNNDLNDDGILYSRKPQSNL